MTAKTRWRVAASARRFARTGDASRKSSTSPPSEEPFLDARLGGGKVAAERRAGGCAFARRAAFLILQRRVGALLDEHPRDVVEPLVAGADQRRVAELVAASTSAPAASKRSVVSLLPISTA